MNLCPRCGGLNGTHGLVHERHPAGGGGTNKRCPNAPVATTVAFDSATEQPEPDPETTPLEALAALAEDLDREGLTEYARRARILAARMGHLVDQVRADATMLTGYAAGVNDRAVAVGIGALREIGDLR